MKKWLSVCMALTLMLSTAAFVQAAAPKKFDCELSTVKGDLKFCSLSAKEVNNELVVSGFFINVSAVPVEKVEKLKLNVYDKAKNIVAEGVFTGDKELAKLTLKPGQTVNWDFSFPEYAKGDLNGFSTEYEFTYTSGGELLPDGINIIVGNQAIKPEVAPFIKDGSTLVPLRAIFEALKAQVSWDGATQTVSAVSGQDKLTLTIGQKELDVNGQKITFDVPSQIVDGSTFVPLRAVSEALGSHVFYGKTNDAVVISIVAGE